MLDSLCEDDWLGLLLMEAAASAAKAGSAAKAMRRGRPAEVPLLQSSAPPLNPPQLPQRGYLDTACSSLYCLLHPSLIAAALPDGTSRPRPSPPASPADAASSGLPPEYQRQIRAKTGLNFVGEVWGGRTTRDDRPIYPNSIP